MKPNGVDLLLHEIRNNKVFGIEMRLYQRFDPIVHGRPDQEDLKLNSAVSTFFPILSLWFKLLCLTFYHFEP